jgi:hypothetical protein
MSNNISSSSRVKTDEAKESAPLHALAPFVCRRIGTACKIMPVRDRQRVTESKAGSAEFSPHRIGG